VPQSLSQIYLHIVFSTKERFPFLEEPAARNVLYAYITGILRKLDCPSQAIGEQQITFIYSTLCPER